MHSPKARFPEPCLMEDDSIDHRSVAYSRMTLTTGPGKLLVSLERRGEPRKCVRVNHTELALYFSKAAIPCFLFCCLRYNLLTIYEKREIVMMFTPTQAS